jgi:hypothetical protein
MYGWEQYKHILALMMGEMVFLSFCTDLAQLKRAIAPTKIKFKCRYYP